MKKTTAFLAGLFLSGFCFAAAPQQTYVATTNTPVLPDRNIIAAPAWVTSTVYSVGSYVAAGPQSNLVYMALTAGTSGSTQPTQQHGSLWDGTVQWYRVEPRPRLCWHIYNDSSQELWLSLGQDAAVVTNGVHLAAYSSIDSRGFPQQLLNLQLNAIGTNGASLVSFQEW